LCRIEEEISSVCTFTYTGEMNMFSKKWMAVVVGAALTAGVAVSDAAPPVGCIVVAREASEGPRGGDNERPGDRQRRGGRLHIEIPADIVIAREAGEGPRGGDNERPGDRQRRGGRLHMETPADIVIAREASEGPRGGDNERPGDRHRRGRHLTSESPADLVTAKGSGRGKTRVPDSSGCDDPEDIIEHPACTIANALATG
jgi:hypothetical protein